jgi:hypothetical protein
MPLSPTLPVTSRPDPRASPDVPARRRLAERAVEKGRDGAASGYVALARGTRRVAHATGVLAALDRRRHRRGALFLRSLFAVHDIADLCALDLAWWTMDAVDQVDRFLTVLGGQAQAFEYGGGASTVWLARRCKRVVTVEHDARWWQVLTAQIGARSNVDLRLVPPEQAQDPACRSERAGWGGHDFSAYVRAIRAAGGPFDLIVIDGRARAACLAEAVGHLAPRGLIVFDNSNRRRYGNAIRGSGLAVERWGGFAPSVPWPSETALLADDPALAGRG